MLPAISGYRIERVLGVGPMAVVAKAIRPDGTPVALKLVTPQNVAGDVTGFLREARAASRIDHEHVVKVFEVGTTSAGRPFLAMELLEGTDLSALLERDRRLPVDVAVDYMRQAATGVAAAQAAGIVHRDLKPGNLFLTKRADGSPLVKVLDFGVSKAIDVPEGEALTETSVFMGSPTYMPPEQIMSARRADQRSDVWALGVILYELVSGGVPFFGESVAEVIDKIVHEDPVPLRKAAPKTPPELAAIVDRCLDKDPAKRPQSAAELADLLTRFAQADAFDDELPTEAIPREVALPLALALASSPTAPTAIPASTGELLTLPYVRVELDEDPVHDTIQEVLPSISSTVQLAPSIVAQAEAEAAALRIPTPVAMTVPVALEASVRLPAPLFAPPIEAALFAASLAPVPAPPVGALARFAAGLPRGNAALAAVVTGLGVLFFVVLAITVEIAPRLAHAFGGAEDTVDPMSEAAGAGAAAGAVAASSTTPAATAAATPPSGAAASAPASAQASDRTLSSTAQRSSDLSGCVGTASRSKVPTSVTCARKRTGTTSPSRRPSVGKVTSMGGSSASSPSFHRSSSVPALSSRRVVDPKNRNVTFSPTTTPS